MAFEAALRAGADALILDAGFAGGPEGRPPGGPRIFGRMAAVALEESRPLPSLSRADGVALWTPASGAEVSRLAVKLSVAEAEDDLPDGATAILPVIGSAAGVMAAAAIAAASPRVLALAWCAEDLATNLGAASTHDEGGAFRPPLATARALVLLAAAAAGVPAIETADPSAAPAAFARSCFAASRDGFAGRLASSVAQLPSIDAAFPLSRSAPAAR